MEHHTIQEWQELNIGEQGISSANAARVHKAAERESQHLRVPQPILSLTAKPSLKAGQVVGVLSTPKACIEILPKIEGKEDGDVRRSLVHMLAVALGLPIAANEQAWMATQHTSLLEILIRIFANRLQELARRGLPHRYQLQSDDLSVLRGKLDMRRQLSQNLVRAERLACVFDEFSVNTPLNRVMKATVRRLLEVSRTENNRRTLIELASRFDSVGKSQQPLKEPVRLDRTNTSFHQIYALARLLLAGDWQDTSMGSSPGMALLFAMNDLFEMYVGRRIHSALYPTPVQLQRHDRYAIESSNGVLFNLKPDIVVANDLVIDTKWKHLDPAKSTLGVAESDVYQMLAYAKAYDAKRLVLLYPWNKNLDFEPGICRSWSITGTKTIFDIATVDVGTPRSVDDTLRKIATSSTIPN